MKPRNNPFLRSAAVQTLRIQVAVAVALGLAAISTPLLRAANTWNGGGGGTFLWSNNANWSGAQPTFGTLTYAGAVGNTNIMDQSYSMNGLNVTSVGPWTMNVSNSAVLSLFDNGGTQAKVENNGGGLLTLNIPITFAATSGNNWGEINAVTGSITFGTGALTVSGTGVNGIRMFGGSGAIATTFNNTVSASGKYFATNSVNQTINIGGAFTSGNFFLMNGGTLKLNTGGTLTTSGGSAEALRLGGDFGTTGSQNLASGATFQLTPLTGGLTTNALINTVANNTSGALLIDSLNTSNTNTLAGDFYLDSNLRVNQASGGTIIISDATTDIKGQTLTLTGGTTGNINLTGVVGNSTGSGQVVVGVDGTVGGPTVTMSQANTYSGQTFVRAGALAFTSTGSAANSTLRLGSTSGTGVDAAINLTTLTGGTTISSVINAVTTSGSGTLSINSNNTSLANTLSGQIALDRNLTINQATGGTLNVTSVHTGADITNVLGTDIKGFTLTLGATGTIAYSGTIYNSTGNGNVTKTAAGTATLSGVNTYTGVTNITGGILSIGGAVGSTISGSSAVSLTGGTALVLDYTFVGDAATNKINDSATVTITAVGSPNAGGSSGLQLLGNAAASTNETIGTLALGGGVSVVGVTQATAGLVTKLTATNGLTRANFGTGLIRGSSLGGAATQVGQVVLGSLTGLVQVGTSTSTTGLAGTVKDLTIVPYLIGDTASGGLGSVSSGSFLTYDTGGRGFRVIAAAEQNQLAASTDTFVGTNVSYSPTVASSVLTLDATNRTWNSLQIGRSSTGVSRTLSGGGGTLAITSGALQTGNQTAGDSTVINGFSRITFGNNVVGANAANEAVIFVNGSSGGAATPLTIGSPIDVTQGGGLTKAGVGTLNLTATNLYTGATTINQGTINIGGGTAAGNLGSSSGVTLNGTSALTFNRTNAYSYSTGAITGGGAAAGNTVTQAGSGALTLGAITGVQTITQSASTGALTTGNISNAGTITQATGAGLLTTGNISTAGTITLNAASGATLGNINTVTTITHAAGAGTLTLGATTGLTTLTDNSITGSTTPTTINQSGTGLTIGTINGASGSRVNFAGDGTGSTTITNLLGTAGQTINVSAGTVSMGASRSTAANLIVSGGTLTTTGTNRLSMANNDSQTLTITGGTLNVLSTADFGVRLGADNGPANATGTGFTGTQSGGTFNALGVNGFSLGSAAASKVASYSLSGTGILNVGSSANVQNLTLGADAAGTSTTTFNLSGGKLLVSGTINGSQGAGAKQAFVFTSGTLAAFTFDATNLTSTLGTAVVLGSTNTLTNAGGILAPGNVGTSGRTVITGNYSVTSANASYAVDLGGTSIADAFQKGAGFYDTTNVSGTTTLGGKLNLSLLSYTPASNGTTLHNILVGATAATSTVTGTFTNQQTATGGNSRVVLADGLSSMLVAINNTGAASTTGGLTSVGARTVAVGNYQAGNTYSGLGTAWDTANAGAWTNFDPGATATPATQASGAIAQFADGTASTGAIGVALNSTRNIQGIQFSSAAGSRAYTISGSGAIILDNTGNNASATIADTSTSGTANAINIPITLASNLAVSVTNAANNLTIGGAIGEATALRILTKTGAGALILSGANTYTGVTTINDGTLQLGNGITTGSLATTGSIVNNANLTINRSNVVIQGTDFSTAAITGSGSFTQAGGGTTTLNAANTYTGGTTVSVGTLLANNTTGSATGTGTVSVFSGAIISGTGTVGGATTINSGGIHDAGSVGGVGKETFSSSLNYNSGSIFEWDLSAAPSTTGRGTNYDAVNAASLGATTGAIFRVVLNDAQDFSTTFWDSTQQWADIFKTSDAGTNLDIASIFSGGFQYYNGSGVVTGVPATQGSFSVSGSTLTWSAVPEPSSALAGLLLAAGLLRRRRSA